MSRLRAARWLSVLFVGFAAVGCADRAHVLHDGLVTSDVRVLDSYGDVRIAPKPAPDRAVVKAKLADARAKHIAELQAYAKKGEFPENTVKPIVANIFRDPSGHLCAVANMVWLDGNRDLVDETAKNDNFVRVADKSSGKLHDWAMTSGFTREEIAMIQVPYMPMPGEGGGPREGRGGIAKNPSPIGGWQPLPEDSAMVRQRALLAEKVRLQRHLGEVASRLADDTDQSLEIATDRLLADPDRDARVAALGVPLETRG